MPKLTQETALQRCLNTHGNKYYYGKMNYTGVDNKIQIICLTCGYEFMQTFYSHTKKNKPCGCPRCANKTPLTVDEMLQRCINIHNKKYDYQETIFLNTSDNIKIFCNTCEKYFFQRYDAHTASIDPQGCPQCSNRMPLTQKTAIEKCIRIHGVKYNYSNSIYSGAKNKINVLCNDCKSMFNVNFNAHTNKNKPVGCSKCAGNLKLTTASALDKCRLIHGDKYDYSNTVYYGRNKNINVFCKTCNKNFSVSYRGHVRKNNPSMCKYCNMSHGERKIIDFLTINNIEYIFHHRFNNCRYKNKLEFDFYLPYLNKCIEFNGEQHYVPIKHFGGIKKFNENKLRDNIKQKFCSSSNIDLIVIPYWENIEKCLQCCL
jgi:hypothetical protein